MRVVGAAIQMSAEQHGLQRYTRRETLRVTVPGDNSGAGAAGDRLDISAAGRAALQAIASDGPAGGACAATCPAPAEDPMLALSATDRLRMLILREVLGIEIKIVAWDAQQPATGDDLAAPSNEAAAERPNFSLEYDLHESYYESERLSFAAAGVIRTADGREISFDVQFTMSREFAAEHRFNLRIGEPVDPLVINYAGTLPEFTTQRFHFDLDGDGKAQAIPLLQPGSGFLALDKNGDGVINSGLELFGPATNDGFAELRRYDADGNGWIDAADPVFERLRIWTRDEEGNDVLFALGEKGIGAIYLGNVAAPFTVKDQHNQGLAQARSAGLFVRNDGSVGTVQQLDLLV